MLFGANGIAVPRAWKLTPLSLEIMSVVRPAATILPSGSSMGGAVFNVPGWTVCVHELPWSVLLIRPRS